MKQTYDKEEQKAMEIQTEALLCSACNRYPIVLQCDVFYKTHLEYGRTVLTLMKQTFFFFFNFKICL